MIRASIHIQRDSNEENDDVLRICDTNIPSGDVFKLLYKTPELGSAHRFHMARHLISGFVADLLKSLSLDTAPFENVQLTTCLQPAVLFHVSDLDRPETRHLIEDIIATAINTPCEIVGSR
jgi:hypothetical protein